MRTKEVSFGLFIRVFDVNAKTMANRKSKLAPLIITLTTLIIMKGIGHI